ncbi:MAG TPA: nucleotidyl transferase AbiEii/AbiGii toxin family protein [Kofleriaceae bacterium]|nr:nucleotidyl transferase AbiEii/AbiGii toxin family protein [Kofleriaceae bacterium]
MFRLMGLLDALSSHPFLKTRIVLKGGTGLNLFREGVPRLSMDIGSTICRPEPCPVRPNITGIWA